MNPTFKKILFAIKHFPCGFYNESNFTFEKQVFDNKIQAAKAAEEAKQKKKNCQQLLAALNGGSGSGGSTNILSSLTKTLGGGSPSGSSVLNQAGAGSVLGSKWQAPA